VLVGRLRSQELGCLAQCLARPSNNAVTLSELSVICSLSTGVSMSLQYRSSPVQTVALPAVGRWLSVAARATAGIALLGALAAVFVPAHPDLLVVFALAVPSSGLAMMSRHLDGRNLLTGASRRRPSPRHSHHGGVRGCSGPERRGR